MTAPHGNSVRLARSLATVLGRLGIDEARFLADLKIDAETSPDAYLPITSVDRALEAVAAKRGDATLALTMAREAVGRPLGMFSNLVWMSGTVGGALAQAARFYSLVTQRATLSLDVEDGDAGARVAKLTQRMRPGAARGNILTELSFGCFFLHARAAAGDAFDLREVRFAHRVRDAAPYEAHFDAPVVFDAPLDELVLDAAMLDLPLRSADPDTAAAIEARATAIDALVEARPLADRLRTAVQAELRSSRPSLATVARRLGVSERSLRRQLEDQRLSLREVFASERRDRALTLLERGTPVKDVAFELGFSEPSAFSRAYKRWTGRSPGSGPRAT